MSNDSGFDAFLIVLMSIVILVFGVSLIVESNDNAVACAILVPAQEESLYGKFMENSDAHYRELDEYGIWFIDDNPENLFQIVGYSLTEDSDIYDSTRCVIESIDD